MFPCCSEQEKKQINCKMNNNIKKKHLDGEPIFEDIQNMRDFIIDKDKNKNNKIEHTVVNKVHNK